MGKTSGSSVEQESRPNLIAAVREREGLTQEQLSELSGISVSYLSRMEAGKRNVSVKNLNKIASALAVSARELIIEDTADAPSVSSIFGGSGTTLPLAGRIVAGGAIDVSTEQKEFGVEHEVQLSINVPDGVVAYQVIGDSMLPVYKPDTVLICRAHTTDVEKHIGRELAIGTVEHGRLLKTVQLGSKAGLYNLESFNASTIRDVPVLWVARIAAIIPADEWHIIERRVQVQNEIAERLKKPSQRRKAVQA